LHGYMELDRAQLMRWITHLVLLSVFVKLSCN